LAAEERAAYDKLCAYVKAFAPLRPLVADGKEVQLARVMDTYGLMVSNDLMDLLGSAFAFIHFFPCSFIYFGHVMSRVSNIFSVLCARRKNAEYPRACE